MTNQDREIEQLRVLLDREIELLGVREEAVGKAHPDWRQVCLTEEFRVWHSEYTSDAMRRLCGSNSALHAVIVLDQFKKDRKSLRFHAYMMRRLKRAGAATRAR